jgi:GGDEF domain-containing protein
MFRRARSKNVTESAPPQDEAGEAALIDKASGLYKDWYFQRRLREEVVRCARYDRPLGVVVWETQLFAGEKLPDEAVARAVAIIRRKLRNTDLAARTDQARFMALLFETPPDLARSLAHRLKSDLQVAVHGGKGPWRGGYAAFPQDGADASALLQMAMRRLKDDPEPSA